MKQYNTGMMTTPENIIYGSYVRKLRLDQIVAETFSNTSIAAATEVNIFIDLYSVLHEIFSRSFRTTIDNPLGITAAIINMCTHYRSYFRYKSVTTRFFLIFSPNIHEMNRKLVAGYNRSFVDKYSVKVFNKLANNNFQILKTLCPYLPNIHFIQSVSGYEVAVIAAYLIEEYGMNIPNIIISKDIYPLQLCTKYPYTSFLFPKKRFDKNTHTVSDISLMVPLNEKDTHTVSFWNVLALKRGSKIKPELYYEIHPSNFMLLQAMHRFPERDMDMAGVGNILTCKKHIIQHMNGNMLTLNPEMMYHNETLQGLPISLIQSRYNALDVSYMLPYYRIDEESQNIQIQNLTDNGEVNNINAKYFADIPLNLQDL